MGAAAPARASGGPGIEAAALNRLHQSHYAIYRRLAFGYLASADDAEEAVQEGFLRAWKFRLHFRGECALSTWLATIIRRECQDRLRRAKVRKAASHVPLDEHDAPAIGDSILETIERGEQRALIVRLLMRLSPAERDHVVRTLAGEPLDMQLGANKSARHRAVLRLSRILGMKR